jgi:hypothetical protein
MPFTMFLAMIGLFVAVFTFDISFNIRRLNNNSDRIWRKLVEIQDLLQKK